MSKNVLVVIDMQNDFIDGALGTKEAQAIIENVYQVMESCCISLSSMPSLSKILSIINF